MSEKKPELCITIGDFRIRKHDSMNLIIEHRVEKQLSKNPNLRKKQLSDGWETHFWRPCGFYGDIAQALKRLSMLKLRESEAQSVDELSDEIRKLRESIESLIVPEGLTVA